MLNTIMFDLHGTLLPIDFQQFMDVYFQEIGDFFQDLIEPQILKKYVLTATYCMVENTGVQTNETVFFEKFKTLIDKPLNIFQQRFDDFYHQGFLKVRATLSFNPLIPDIINRLKQKGYYLVIATNPVFPIIAVYRFIEWAGLTPGDFSYISCIEQNHYCKPNPNFYGEILQTIDKTPAQCLMVGNDTGEDMAAETLGIKTYLITNYLIRQTPGEIQCAYQGTYEDFYRFVAALPPVPLLHQSQ